MWKPFGGKPSGPESFPEADDAALRVVLLLRIELLYATVVYGMCAVLAEQGEEIDGWLAMFEWVRDLVAMVREGLEPSCNDYEPPDWLQTAIDAAASADGLRRSDLFRESVVRRWAREELESLCERSRPIEELGGEPLGEIVDRPSAAGIRLLALVQDSLVLVGFDQDGETRCRPASAAEVLDQLIAAREEGVWELFVS